MQQRNEVINSQTAIATLRKGFWASDLEIRDLTVAKQAAEKQWEDALVAMSTRDKAIQVNGHFKFRILRV